MKARWAAWGALALLAIPLGPPVPAQQPAAADSATSVLVPAVPDLPLGIAEVVTGGRWAEGAQNGFYRVIAMVDGREEARSAAVFLQWIAENEDGDAVAIAASVPIREVGRGRLPSVSVALESELENDAQLTIAAPEAAEPERRLLIVRAGAPGRYAVVPPMPIATPQAPAAGAAEPQAAPPATAKAPTRRSRH